MKPHPVLWKRLLVLFITYLLPYLQPIDSINYKNHTWKRGEALEEHKVELHIQMK